MAEDTLMLIVPKTAIEPFPGSEERVIVRTGYTMRDLLSLVLKEADNPGKACGFMEGRE